MKTAQLVTTTKAQLENGDLLVLPCPVNYYYITTDAQAQEAVEELLPIVSNPKTKIALDIETTGYDPYRNDIILLQIGTEQDLQYIFDVRRFDKTIITPLLDTDCWKLGHNLKFDAKFVKVKFGVDVRRFFDTFLAEKVIRGGSYTQGGYSLDVVLKYRLNREMTIEATGFAKSEDEAADRVKKQMQQSFLSLGDKDPSPAQLAYAAQDTAAATIFALAEVQTKQLYKLGPNTLYNSEVERLTDDSVRKEYQKLFPPQMRLWETACLEFKFLEVVIDMELLGIGFSKPMHAEVVRNFQHDYVEYKKEFLRLLGKNTPQRTLFGTAGINPDSNPQVLESLNRLKLNLPDTGSDTLDAKLRELNENTLEYKIVKSLLNYRVMSKLVQAFGDKLAVHIHPATERIHFEIQQVLDTGRISNKNPNLQQIPKKINWMTTGDPEKDAVIKARNGLRECFVAKPGHRFVIFDYSQQELRVAASISLDKTMLRAFAEGKELHSYSATLMYGGDYEEFAQRVKQKDPDAVEKRSYAKIVSFGSLYGSGPSNLAKTLHITLEKAKDVLDRFWGSYPDLSRAMQRYGDLAAKVGYSNTVLGRRRYYTDILDRIKWVELSDSPATIQKKCEELGMKWLLEKEGSINEANIGYAKKCIVRKYKGDIARQAGNHHIQGTSADMTKKAAIAIRTELRQRKIPGNIVGLVHDEVIVEVPTEFAEEVKDLVELKMKQAMNLFCPNVPAEADGHVVDCWNKD